MVGGALVAGATAAAVTRLLRARPPVLPPPPPGEPRRWAWRHADLFVTVRGAGPPILLLHDVYTGAGGHEMVALGDRLAAHHTVHTLDLPGFGRSGKPRMRYSPGFFTDAIVEYVRHGIDAPAVLTGSGLTAAYVVDAAARLGDLAAGIILLGPFEGAVEPFESPVLNRVAYQLLRTPFGELYHHVHAIAPWRRRALRAWMAAPGADLDGRADALHRYASQPGAEWPLWSLWCGELTEDPRARLAEIEAPVLAVWGAETHDDPSAPEAYRAARPDITQRVIPGTSRWPHVDDPDATAEAILSWRP
jgi:pimeloyl-ACP methyl ester carboxylesterase